jgi:hypothetical protein
MVVVVYLVNPIYYGHAYTTDVWEEKPSAERTERYGKDAVTETPRSLVMRRLK